MTKLFTITSTDEKSRATFAPELGGLCTSIIMQEERELLYFPKDFSLENYQGICGGWPFLFPICARIARNGTEGIYLYNGKQYHLDIHGFASTMAWELIDLQKDQLTIKLTDTEKTREQFPFSFSIELTYKVENNRFICVQKFSNTGIKSMPYYAGFHPYFLIDPKKYEKNEVSIDYRPIRRFAYNKDLTDIIGERNIFKTPIAISNPEINENLTGLGEDKSITMSFPDGYRISMTATGIEDPDMFSYMQLYNVQEEPFFCLEPWMSFPNALNTVEGSRWLKPGETEGGVVTLIAQ